MRLRKWLIRLGLVVLGLVLALAATEVVLRLVDYRAQGTRKVDYHLGSSFYPGMIGRWTYEGRGDISISSQGLRDRFFPWKKDGRVFRIAVVGDSFMAALQVDVQQGFAKQLEKLLRRAGWRAEVINFGVPGFGTAQELVQLKTKVVRFDPDLVILALFSGNDVRNNLRQWQADNKRPYYVLQADGRLVLDNRFRQASDFKFRSSFWGRVIYWFKSHTRLMPFLNDQINLLRMKWRARKGRLAAKKQPRKLVRTIYTPHLSATVRRAYRVTEAILAEVKRFCHTRGWGLVVMNIPATPAVHRKLRRQYAREQPQWNLDAPRRWLNQVCARHKMKCLDLTGPFTVENAATGRRFNGFGAAIGGHWTAYAHHRAAALMRNFLVQNKLIPDRYHRGGAPGKVTVK